MPVLTIGALSLLLTGCAAPPAPAPAPVDMAAITAEIQALEDAYAKAAVAKDADGIVAYYADDVVIYSREKEPVVGKAAIRQMLAEKMAKDTSGTTPSFKVLEIFMGNDQLTEIGSWTDTDAAGTVVDNGTYFSVFKKTGDKWQCIRDISVSAKPKETAAPVVAMQ